MDINLDLTQEQLEQGHDYLEKLLAFWDKLTAGVPPDQLPYDAYMGCTLLALVLWLLVARVLPKPFGAVTWFGLFALLCTPTVTGGITPKIAPACVGFVYGFATKNTAIMLSNAIAILSMFALGLFITFMWQRIKSAGIDYMLLKQNKQARV